MFLLIPSAFFGALIMLVFSTSPSRRPGHWQAHHVLYAYAAGLIGLLITALVPLARILNGVFTAPSALQTALSLVMALLGAVIAERYIASQRKKGKNHDL